MSAEADQSARIEHLKLIQAAVERMARESAAMKRYCVVVVAAALGLAIGAAQYAVLLLVIPIAAVFWGLDARYLQQERWFRDLYDAKKDGEGRPDFAMTPDARLRAGRSWLGAAAGWSCTGLYLPLIAFLFILWVIVALSA
ncbi:MAG: hypothetical protein GVY13_06705 [Alphaproteobacteria bacterium]|nr:hypothetical protein [Alphaproteobacteria bacterium]